MHSLLLAWQPLAWQPLAWSALFLAAAVAGGLLLHHVLFAVLARLARSTQGPADDAWAVRLRPPMRLLVPLVAVQLVEPALRFPPGTLALITRVTTLCLVAAVAWLGIRLLGVLETALLARHPEEVGIDPTAKRVATTQLRLLRRVLGGVVLLIAVAVMLLTFPRVRALGASLLASAGIVALVAGIALRPAVANLIAGIQIAISRPIDLEDVVVVEGEWGRIEKITLTYVVVRLWDLRRLVLPISYFTDKPFQNWTRGSREVVGSAFVHADYRVPVEAVRQELLRILQASERWDKKTWALQVTDATERTVQLRATMSAADSESVWELRCEVREKLVDFLQREHPASLPRRRTEQGPLDDDAADQKTV